MALTEANYRAAAKRAGVPVWLLKAQVGQESGGRQGARSPVGASGVEQLMPATAAALAKKYKVNTRTPFGNLLAGAYYLREQYNAFKRWDLALAAYNAGPGAVHEHGGIPPFHETQHYVSTIMRNAAQIRKQYGSVPSIQPQEPLSAPHSPGATPSFNPREFALSQLGELSKGSYDPVGSLEQLHQSMMAQAQAAKLKPPPQTPVVGNVTGAKTGAGSLGQAAGDWAKYVRLGKGADRAGMRTHQAVLMFVGRLGANLGRALTIGTGTNHNEYVLGTHRESAHWEGNAADIPAAGTQLTRMGRRALILAGMDPREARKVKGGLFNIGGYQIIFNSNIGGNHYNHLHVGLRS
jgi:hypothetical protein